MTWKGQSKISPEAQGLKRLGNAINHLVGVTVSLLSVGGEESLFMQVENGNFRIALGDKTGSLTFTAPSGSVTDGSGSILLKAGDILEITKPTEITAAGDVAGAILTYWTH